MDPPDRHSCRDCGNEFEVDGTELVCTGCDARILNYSSQGVSYDGVSNYSTSTDTSAPITLQSAGGPTVILCQVAPYKKTRLQDIVSEIRCLLGANQGLFFQRIIDETAAFFYSIVQNQVLRGDVRKGTVAACFYIVCRSQGMVQKNEYLAGLFNVHRNQISKGNKIIENQVNYGLIPEPPSIDVLTLMRNYLQQYFTGFKLPEVAPNRVHYFDFCLRVSYFCWVKNIGLTSIPSSKCAGSLYLLAARVPGLVDVSRVKDVCECTPSTAKRFSSAVELFLRRDPDDLPPSKLPGFLRTLRQLRHIFRKFGLPLQPVRQPRSTRRRAGVSSF